MSYNEEDRKRLRIAIRTITAMKDHPPYALTQKEFEVLSWTVLRLVEELEFSKEPLTEQELEFGREVARRISERNNITKETK